MANQREGEARSRWARFKRAPQHQARAALPLRTRYAAFLRRQQDWTRVTPGEIWRLAEAQFEVTNTPGVIRRGITAPSVKAFWNSCPLLTIGHPALFRALYIPINKEAWKYGAAGVKEGGRSDDWTDYLGRSVGQ
jgi:hypothetical protein